MKSNNFTYAKGPQTVLFCFGMFLLAMTFTVVICFSTFYAFQSLKSDGGVAKSGQVAEGGSKNTFANAE